ncbi:MAG: FTR1 family protein [Chloroflexi bacterium]|nr:FTR1 family protein [Chloroflexota bacterium]
MLSALLIAAREGLEAALIVGIVLGFLHKTERRGHTSFAWLGVAVAVTASVALALLMRFVGAELKTPYEQMFEGTTMLLAVAVLTWMLFWMRYQSRFLKVDLERKMQSAISDGQNWGLFAIAFLAVFREGLETALFLAANAFAADAASTLAGALLGLALAVAVGVLIYIYAVRIDIQLFFNVTSLFLIVFAAGLVAGGIHEFQEIGWLPILTGVAWDTKWLLANDSALGSVLRSLVGYNDQPSLLEVVSYLAYWIVILQAIRWWTQHLAVRLIRERASAQSNM